jgi:hypothetical protein
LQKTQFIPEYLKGWREQFEAWKAENQRRMQPCQCIACPCQTYEECEKERHWCCMVERVHW